MSAPTVTVQQLVAWEAAIEKALSDDRERRVHLPKATYMELLRASGSLQSVIQRLDVQVPVTTE